MAKLGNKLPLAFCSRCPLRHRLLAGISMAILGEAGGKTPTVLVIGIAPGGVENAIGRPFMGPAGQFLRETIGKARLTSFYLCNMLMCKLPQNRDPNPDEIGYCSEHIGKIIKAYSSIQAVMYAGRIVAHNASKYSIWLKHLPYQIEVPHPASVSHARDAKAVREVKKKWTIAMNLLEKAGMFC